MPRWRRRHLASSVSMQADSESRQQGSTSGSSARGASDFPAGKSRKRPTRSRGVVASPETVAGRVVPPPVHLRHSGGRKENPSENHNLITPICSGTASHFCLPGCLSPMLSSTLFSISCNHLLEISFSFQMSPWKGNSAGWEWAEPTTRKAAQLGHSLKALSGFLFGVGLFRCPALGYFFFHHHNLGWACDDLAANVPVASLPVPSSPPCRSLPGAFCLAFASHPGGLGHT